MKTRWWCGGAFVVLCIALGGCASAPARADSAASSQSAPAPSAPPVAAPVQPTNAQTAFLDGYRAYQSHDDSGAIVSLKFAADNFPALGDYALYYLAFAQHDQGDLNGSAVTLDRLVKTFPQSVTIDPAEAMLADNLLKLGRNAEASEVASRLIARGPEASIEQGARVTEARSLIALGNPKSAYAQLMELRDKYPRSDADAEARVLVHEILASHPEVVADTNSLAYHRAESQLLLREGALSEADEQANAGLAMSPEPAVRAELEWVTARALKPEPERAKRAILEYLQIAPRGPDAAAALEALALIYWHDDQDDPARATFNRLVANFPGSELAPGAMLRVGKIFEELHQLDSARDQYRRLTARYPGSDAAEEARFRIPWTLYLARNYRSAVPGFQSGAARAKDPINRDMCEYWHARALEKAGDAGGARAIFEKLANSTDSNYYPELASRRVAASSPDLPAASAPDPRSSTPAVSGVAEYHMARLQTLRALGLKDLEPGELKALEEHAGGTIEMRRFVLAGFASADAWYDAIVAATHMEKIGQLSHDVAERVRYPRAYWDLFQPASRRLALDPYLVLALSRQESLFNPRATSSSNARGLMQLIPSTARKMASQNSMDTEKIALYDPSVNVKLGTTYLKNLFEMFHGDEFHAVAAYNGGENAVSKWIAKSPGPDDEWVENIAYKETREYVKKVIGGRREYLLLYRRN
jgi:soluble lytic murein transglycosylase